MKPFLQRSLWGAEVVHVVRFASAAIALSVGSAFLVAGLSIRAALHADLTQQATIRQARLSRSHVLALQLDEETGVRGFAATGSRIFLGPFNHGRASWRPAMAQLRVLAMQVDPASIGWIDREERLNEEWLESFARPMLREPRLRHSVPAFLAAKGFVDAFRKTDRSLAAALEQASRSVDLNGGLLVDRIVLVAAVAGLLAVLACLVAAAFFVRIIEEMHEQRRAYEEEKRVADMLQEAFVQKALPHIATVALDAVYVPAGRESQVGGDWYDAFELADKRVMFSIGDVCGHGVHAAIVMSRARQAILSASISNADPGRVLALANEALMLQGSTMVTAICGFIEPWSMRIVYAVAGHPPPILAHADGTVAMLAGSGVPLGIVNGPSYVPASAQGAPEAMLVLYTDGLVEYGRDILAGEERLRKAAGEAALARCADPAQRILNAVFAGAAPADDVALLVAAFARHDAPSMPGGTIVAPAMLKSPATPGVI